MEPDAKAFHLLSVGFRVPPQQGREAVDLLRDVDATIRRGEVYAVVGASGAGKSTLLRLLNRLLEPTSGRIEFDGRDLRELPPTTLRRRVGMVFQEPVRFPGTVEDNLLYGLGKHRTDRHGSLARGWMERIAIDARALSKPMRALSGGEAQRVNLARALTLEPEALLLDEPTASLDAASAERVEEIVLEEVAARRLTAVWVTHTPDQTRRVARRGLLLHRGAALCEGDVDEVLAHAGRPRARGPEAGGA
ncbi:MAG: ATP-binding cassette domain-containing protein [Myxococcales bacterium]|nr:ATP-binding cassette domain-containing protein [Myxococcales bacterium]